MRAPPRLARGLPSRRNGQLAVVGSASCVPRLGIRRRGTRRRMTGIVVAAALLLGMAMSFLFLAGGWPGRLPDASRGNSAPGASWVCLPPGGSASANGCLCFQPVLHATHDWEWGRRRAWDVLTDVAPWIAIRKVNGIAERARRTWTTTPL